MMANCILQAGALISVTTYSVIYASTKNKKKAFWMSLSAATLAGVVKEAMDNRKEKINLILGI